MPAKVLVIGAGLIGVCSAYFLRRRGHDVTVVDPEKGPGLQTSFANGSLLTPSMPEPWNAPGSWKVMLGSLGRSDSPLQVRLGALPSLAGWGIEFLRNSSPATYRRSTLANLKLAQHSLEVTRAVRDEHGIEFGHRANGTLKLLRDAPALRHAVAWARELEAQGLDYRELSPRETTQLEPALGPIEARLAGAIYYPGDETGNAYRFTARLAEVARAEGVVFRLGTRVTALEKRADGTAAARIEGDTVMADAIVAAAGSYTTPLLSGIGVRVPVRPVKGYSITFERDPGPAKLGIAVLDESLHAVVVPLEGGIRVAGTAEFTGFDLSPNAARIANLTRLLGEVLPEARVDPASGTPWCGLRPMASNGVPLIGRTSIPNLWINTGHGHLGWTMAAGSGLMLADLLSGAAPAVDPAPYAPRE